MDQSEAIAHKWKVLSPHLNERQRRLWAGVEARTWGRGGIAAVAKATGMSRSTVQDAVGEIDAGPELTDRVRREGAGRKPITQTDPGLVDALDALVEPTARGDPMSALRWTAKSLETLAAELTAQGHPVSSSKVGQLLKDMGYSLLAPAKEVEGAQHVDRDAQFSYINDQAKAHLVAGQPIINVDTKKKEVVRNLSNKGKEYQPSGEPVKVNVHDFPDPKVGKAIPFGIYDIGADQGVVRVGADHDTAAFAVATIARWWEMVGSHMYPDATKLLITADAGGSNSYRNRLWKVELAKLAERIGVEIMVCHLPPGTSKWKKIEHRLFSHISMNWRGRPLESHEVVVELIGATTTATGLRVQAELDRDTYRWWTAQVLPVSGDRVCHGDPGRRQRT